MPAWPWVAHPTSASATSATATPTPATSTSTYGWNVERARPSGSKAVGPGRAALVAVAGVGRRVLMLWGGRTLWPERRAARAQSPARAQQTARSQSPARRPVSVLCAGSVAGLARDTLAAGLDRRRSGSARATPLRCPDRQVSLVPFGGELWRDFLPGTRGSHWRVFCRIGYLIARRSSLSPPWPRSVAG